MTMSANVPAANVPAAKVTAAKVTATKVTATDIGEAERTVEWPRIIAWAIIA